MAVRLSRPEQVERNRQLVLDAALRVFLERGYAGAAMEAIATEAGFTQGVIYSQFSGKADLFFALLEGRIEGRAAERAELAATEVGPAGVLALLRRAERQGEDHGAWLRVVTEFRLIAARDDELGRRYSQLHQRALDGFARAIEEILGRSQHTTPFDLDTLTRLLFVVEQGRVVERAIDPHAIPLEQLEQLFALLIGLGPGAQPPRKEQSP